MFIQTNTVDVLDPRTSEDEYGDDRDDHVIIKRDVPAAIGQRTRSFVNEGESRIVTVRDYQCLLPSRTPVHRGGRLRDNRGRYFMIDHVHEPESFIGGVPTRVEMHLVE